MPQYEDRVGRIIGIDPGTNHVGLAWIDFDVVNLSILQTQSVELIAEKMNPNTWFSEIHGDRQGRLQALGKNLQSIFTNLQPALIVSESPFFNVKRPGAFVALVEAIGVIRIAVSNYDQHQSLLFIDPSSVKKAVGAPGNAKKEVVQQSILTIPEINYVGPIPLQHLDEHSIDAIAVAYSKLIEIRKNRS